MEQQPSGPAQLEVHVRRSHKRPPLVGTLRVQRKTEIIQTLLIVIDFTCAFGGHLT